VGTTNDQSKGPKKQKLRLRDSVRGGKIKMGVSSAQTRTGKLNCIMSNFQKNRLQEFDYWGGELKKKP